jgi:hypothetical protein
MLSLKRAKLFRSMPGSVHNSSERGGVGNNGKSPRGDDDTLGRLMQCDDKFNSFVNKI